MMITPGLLDAGGIPPQRGNMTQGMPGALAPMPQPTALPPTLPPGLLDSQDGGEGVPLPGAQKRSVISRVLHAIDPYKPDPAYSGLLAPEEQQYAHRQAIQQLGIGLLANSGPRPRGTAGFGDRIGAAAAGVNWQDIQAKQAQSAYQLYQMHLYRQQMEGMQQIMGDPSDPQPPNATPEQVAAWLARKVPKLIALGGVAAEHGEKLTDLIKTLSEPSYDFQPGFVGGKPRMLRTNKRTGTSNLMQLDGTPAGESPNNFEPQALHQQGVENTRSTVNEYTGKALPLIERAGAYKNALDPETLKRARGRDAIAQTQLISAASQALGGGVQGGGRGEALLNLIEKSKPLYAKIDSFRRGIFGQAQLLTADEVGQIERLLVRGHNETARQHRLLYGSYRNQPGGSELIQPPEDMPEPSGGNPLDDEFTKDAARRKGQ